MPIFQMMTTFKPIYVLAAILFLASISIGQEKKNPQIPVNKDKRESVLTAILKTQASQLNYLRTRDQAQTALNQAEADSKKVADELQSLLSEVRKLDKVSESCNPTIELVWDCPPLQTKLAEKK